MTAKRVGAPKPCVKKPKTVVRVALVSSDGRCGIAEHSNLLIQSVQQADPEIEFVRDATWLNPIRFFADASGYDLVHINHHRGLHSQWVPEVVSRVQTSKVLTLHDTYETQPDTLLFDLAAVADAIIVHEPIAEMLSPFNVLTGKTYYWRQGVPEPTGIGGRYNPHSIDRPIIGTCGFAFPWKGFELLCDAAASVGWGVSIFSHNATSEQANDWERRNPWVYLDRQYYSTPEMIANLAACDATAFLYSCANSGTSGAIRLGIAAGKPLLATIGCRQFRDLYPDGSIHWVQPDVSLVARELHHLLLLRFSSEIVALRERDSWRHLGKKYADLYRLVA